MDEAEELAATLSSFAIGANQSAQAGHALSFNNPDWFARLTDALDRAATLLRQQDAELKALREPSEEMVERAARAICARHADEMGELSGMSADDYWRHNSGAFEQDARAALAAMTVAT